MAGEPGAGPGKLQAAAASAACQEDAVCFQEMCHVCFGPSDVSILPMEIPHFKQVIVFASSCVGCGARDNEVRPGGGFASHGTRTEVIVETTEDLDRDVLISTSATVMVPALDFEYTSGALGGRFSTIEGVLRDVRRQLTRANPFLSPSDSDDVEKGRRFSSFLGRLEALLDVQEPFTLIVDDPASNSYIANPYAPDDDPAMKVVTYQRTSDQDDDLGLTGMDAPRGDPDLQVTRPQGG